MSNWEREVELGGRGAEERDGKTRLSSFPLSVTYSSSLHCFRATHWVRVFHFIHSIPSDPRKEIVIASVQTRSSFGPRVTD